MLILTRKIGEALFIGDNIRVVVLDIRGKQIRLGIEAPADILVLREEILQRLSQENLQAANFRQQDLVDLAASGLRAVTAPPFLAASISQAGTINLPTKDVGSLQVNEDQVITFSPCLAGFAQCHRYALIHDPQIFPLLRLQCLDDASVALTVTDPGNLVPDYQISSVTRTLKDMGTDNLKALQVLVIVTVPPGRPQEMTANLMCPLLIDPKLRQGKQVVLENSHYSPRHRGLPCPGSMWARSGAGLADPSNKPY